MTNREQSTSVEVSPASPVAGRRRFLKAGVSATPALVTLAAQPALGASCFTPSRSLSTNTSIDTRGYDGVCNGTSPGKYMTGKGWPALVRKSTKFHDVFFGTRFMVQYKNDLGVIKTRSLTLLEVLNLNPNKLPDGVIAPVNDDPSQLAFHIIAAYLNVKNLSIPPAVLDVEKIQTIWKEWDLRKYFEPTAGVQWNAGAIVDYLKNSRIAP